MTIQPGDVLRVTWEMQDAGGNTFQNVYYWRHGGIAPVADSVFLAAAAAHIDTAMVNLHPFQMDNVDPTVMKTYNETQADPLDDVDLSPLSGGSGGPDSLPFQVSGLVTFSTGLRKSLGKKYMGPIIRAATTGSGNLSPTLQTALAAYASQILTNLTAGGETFLVGHYRAATAVFVDWIGSIVENIFATQRRRKPGVGI